MDPDELCHNFEGGTFFRGTFVLIFEGRTTGMGRCCIRTIETGFWVIILFAMYHAGVVVADRDQASVEMY